MDDLRSDFLRVLSGWTLEQQLRDIANTVALRQMARGSPSTNYACTDRELNCLGLLVGLHESFGQDVHRFPSGAVVRLAPSGSPVEDCRVESQVQVTDLPPYIADWVTRLPSDQQEKRERELERLFPEIRAQEKRYGHKQLRIRADRARVERTS